MLRPPDRAYKKNTDNDKWTRHLACDGPSTREAYNLQSNKHNLHLETNSRLKNFIKNIRYRMHGEIQRSCQELVLIIHQHEFRLAMDQVKAYCLLKLWNYALVSYPFRMQFDLSGVPI